MNWADGAAVCASGACLFHCLGLPLAIAALPSIADRIGVGEGFHLAMVVFAIPTSALTLLAAWRRHRTWAPLALGVIGLALMLSGLFHASTAAQETLLTVGGSLSLALAHVVNWRARREARVRTR